MAGLSDALARTFAGHIERLGRETLVNGKKTKALWKQGQPDRVSFFMSDSDWERGVYIVQLLPAVLRRPFTIKNGSEVIRRALGWRTVVRHVDVLDPGDTVIKVVAICVVTPE